MKRTTLINFVVLGSLILICCSPVVASAADFGRVAFQGPQYIIYEGGGNGGGVVVTAKIIGSYQEESEFIAAINSAMGKVKELYAGRYSLSKNNQRVFSSGELLSPGGSVLNDCKAYNLTPKRGGRPGGPPGRNGQRPNGPPRTAPNIQ